MLQRIKMLTNKHVAQQIIRFKKSQKISKQTILRFGFFIRNNYKQDAQDLLEIYSRLDAFYSMAKAHVKYNFSFPVFTQNIVPHFEAKQLYHPLLPTPVAYDITLMPQQNFLFLPAQTWQVKAHL